MNILLSIEEKAQIRQHVVSFVTELINRTGGINVKQVISEICSDLKANGIKFTTGIVAGTVNKTADKLIFGIGA